VKKDLYIMHKLYGALLCVFLVIIARSCMVAGSGCMTILKTIVHHYMPDQGIKKLI